MLLLVLKYIGCILTALVGVFALFAPKRTEGFTGLIAPDARGVTEIRVVLGMFFIALGLFPVITGSAVAFQMLGAAYFLVGIARIVSIFVDRSGNQSNWFSVVFELVFGAILFL